ncbi:MAG TPA: GAF domain-containing protein [Trueperaceae bacterium]
METRGLGAVAPVPWRRAWEWEVDLGRVKAPGDLAHRDVFGPAEDHGAWSREPARDHVLEDDRAAFDAAVDAALSGEPLVLDVRVLWHDRATRWLSVRGRLARDGAGRPARGWGVTVDVTEEQRDRQLLAVQAEMLELASRERPLDDCLAVLCAAVTRLSPGTTASVRLEGAGEAEHGPRRNCHGEPIVASDGSLLGEVHFCFPEEREAAPWERRLVATAARLAAVVVERDAARRMAEQERPGHEFLLELSDAFRVLEDEEEVGRLATRLLCERLGAGMAFVGEFDEASDAYTLGPGHAVQGAMVPAGTFRPSAFAELMNPLEDGPHVVDDVAAREALPEARRRGLLAVGIASFITVPLHRGPRNPIWCLSVAAPQPRRWQDGEVMLVTEVAERTWSAMQRARATAALRESRQELMGELADARRLQEASLRLIEEDDIQSLYGQLLDAAVSVMGARFGSIQMLDSERQQLKLLASRGFTPEARVHFSVVAANAGTSCAAALASGRRVVVPDMETSSLMAGTRDLEVSLACGMRSGQSTPLLSRDGYVVGMISTYWDRPHEPSERKLRLLDVLARQAADLIERRAAQEELARVNLSLERANRKLERMNQELERQVSQRTEELRRSQLRFQQAFEVSPVAAFITAEGEGRVLDVNRAFTRLTGYGPELAVGKTTRELGLWASRPDRELMEATVAAGARFEGVEVRLRCQDGALRDVLASGDRVRLDDGYGWLQLFLDVSEQKRSQEELMRAIKEVMTDTTWFSRRLVERLALVQGRPEDHTSVELLSERERQVLARISQGMTNDEIAAELAITPRTVRNHLANIYAKIDVHSRAEAVVWARERGITT